MKNGVIRGLLDLFFPPKCVFCRGFLKSGERYICAWCKETIPYTEGKTVSQKGEFFSECVSPLFYSGVVRESILRFKFKSMSNYAACYGKLLAECISDRLNGRYDIITWVPLSDKRQKARGYDQAMLLAMATALELGDVAVEVLVKPRDIPAQSGIDAAEQRRANVMGAFEVHDSELVREKRILIIDDIITTGSTLSECARVLKSAGATDVVCAALARGK
jgi:ComF family protein